MRWYDRWLKGVDTGILDEPPIRIWLMGADDWRTEHEWPLARTEWTKLYLRRWRGLAAEPEPTPGRPTASSRQPPGRDLAVARLAYFRPTRSATTLR